VNKFRLVFYTADMPVYEGECVSMQVPLEDGEYGIWAGHSNTIAAVYPGLLKYRVSEEGEECVYAVSEGILKIEDNEVLLLADSAERPEEIDINRARREEEAAKEEMLQRTSDVEYRRAQTKLARALNRLRVRGYNDKDNV